MTTDQEGSHRGLRANAIGLGGDVIVAVANVAPSSAVAFTLALLLTLTGLASPLVVVIVGALMLCVTPGYAAMNRWRPSAGAPYVWVGEATTPVAGIGTGLLSALGATLFNIGNITLAGAYLLFVVSPSMAKASGPGGDPVPERGIACPGGELGGSPVRPEVRGEGHGTPAVGADGQQRVGPQLATT